MHQIDSTFCLDLNADNYNKLNNKIIKKTTEFEVYSLEIKELKSKIDTKNDQLYELTNKISNIYRKIELLNAQLGLLSLKIEIAFINCYKKSLPEEKVHQIHIQMLCLENEIKEIKSNRHLDDIKNKFSKKVEKSKERRLAKTI